MEAYFKGESSLKGNYKNNYNWPNRKFVEQTLIAYFVLMVIGVVSAIALQVRLTIHTFDI